MSLFKYYPWAETLKKISPPDAYINPAEWSISMNFETYAWTVDALLELGDLPIGHVLSKLYGHPIVLDEGQRGGILLRHDRD